MNNATFQAQDNSNSISLSNRERFERRISKKFLRNAYASPLRNSFLWSKYLIQRPLSDIAHSNGSDHWIKVYFVPLIEKVKDEKVMKCELKIVDENEFSEIYFIVKNLDGIVLAEDSSRVANNNLVGFEFYACRVVMTDLVEKAINRDGTPNEKVEKEIEHVVLNVFEDED